MERTHADHENTDDITAIQREQKTLRVMKEMRYFNISEAQALHEMEQFSFLIRLLFFHQDVSIVITSTHSIYVG